MGASNEQLSQDLAEPRPQPPGRQGSRLVLFDFDGTITTRDTLIEFARFYKGAKGFLQGMALLSPALALFKLGVIPNWKAKQFFLSHFFKGEPVATFDARCLEFSATVLPRLIRPQALEAIARYKMENATMSVVTASAENWVKPWCDKNGLECLGTKLEATDGVLTGKIKGKNCQGDEKVCRIKESFDLDQYGEVIAYGDTSGDREMLAMADRSFYKPFRNNNAAS